MKKMPTITSSMLRAARDAMCEDATGCDMKCDNCILDARVDVFKKSLTKELSKKTGSSI